MQRLRLSAVLLAGSLFGLAACDNPVSADRLPPPTPEEITYASSLNITLSQFTRTTLGVYTQDQVVGTGAVIASGDSVSVGYTGWLPNGVQFDTNQPNGSPLRFRVGAQAVVPGFENGVIGMRVGGTRRIVIPSPLAYGRAGQGTSIPGNAVLVFSITMSQRF
jgi:FKBP-type peptidyl-prolyl cis-trans isomerase FkpA